MARNFKNVLELSIKRKIKDNLLLHQVPIFGIYPMKICKYLDISLFSTTPFTSPFSFLNAIFWNKSTMIIFFVRIFQALKLSETELEESGRLSRLSALSDGEKRYVQFILFHYYSHPIFIVFDLDIDFNF